MRSARLALSPVLSSILASSPGVAWAGPPETAKPPPATGDGPAGDPPAGASADEQAAHWLAAGNKAFKEGRFAEAERAYRQAFAVKKGFDIAGNLGAAELAEGKLRECAQHLAFTLRNFPLTGEPALREQMNRAYQQCRRGAGAVRVKPRRPRRRRLRGRRRRPARLPSSTRSSSIPASTSSRLASAATPAHPGT